MLNDSIPYMKTTMIGVHVGGYQNNNHATMFYENLWLDFMLPTIQILHDKHGIVNKDQQFKENVKRLFSQYG